MNKSNTGIQCNGFKNLEKLEWRKLETNLLFKMEQQREQRWQEGARPSQYLTWSAVWNESYRMLLGSRGSRNGTVQGTVFLLTTSIFILGARRSCWRTTSKKDSCMEWWHLYSVMMTSVIIWQELERKKSRFCSTSWLRVGWGGGWGSCPKSLMKRWLRK